MKNYAGWFVLSILLVVAMLVLVVMDYKIVYQHTFKLVIIVVISNLICCLQTGYKEFDCDKPLKDEKN